MSGWTWTWIRAQAWQGALCAITGNHRHLHLPPPAAPCRLPPCRLPPCRLPPCRLPPCRPCPPLPALPWSLALGPWPGLPGPARPRGGLQDGPVYWLKVDHGAGLRLPVCVCR